jgi:hypothetical protein
VPAAAIGFPVGWIRPAEAKQKVLHGHQIEVAAENLDYRDHDIDVEEKIQIDVSDVHVDRRAVAIERNAHAPDVVPPEYPDRRLEPPPMRALSFPVQHALYVGQEIDELGVVALLESTGVAVEFVPDYAPRIVRTALGDEFPMPMNLHIRTQRHQLQRPKQDLAKATHLRASARNRIPCLGRSNLGHGHLLN